MAGFRNPKVWGELITTTADITLGVGDVGKIVCNVGASAQVTVTLPTAANCQPGGQILVLSCADQNLIVAPATADTLIIMNDIAADSTSFQTVSEKAGGGFLCTCVGPKWHISPMITEAQTQTTAT